MNLTRKQSFQEDEEILYIEDTGGFVQRVWSYVLWGHTSHSTSYLKVTPVAAVFMWFAVQKTPVFDCGVSRMPSAWESGLD